MNWVHVPTEQQEKLLHGAKVVVTEVVKTEGTIREVCFYDAKSHQAYKLIVSKCGGSLELLTPEVTKIYMVYGKQDSLFPNFQKAFKTSGEASSYLHKMLGDAGIAGSWGQYFEVKEHEITDISAFFSPESEVSPG